MPDRDLNRRSPFGVDEKAVQLLHAILSHAAKRFENNILIKYSDKGDLAQHQKEQLASEIPNCTAIEYVVSCSDKTSNHKLTFDELVTPKIFLQLGADPGLSNNIRCKVIGDYGFINDYGSQIEGWIRSARKKYWWAYKIAVVLTIVVSTILIVIPIIYLGMKHITIIDENERSKVITGIVSVGIIVGLAFMPIIMFIGRILFPIGEFAIGRGAGRQRRREHIVYSLFGGAVLVGLVVSVFGNLVTGAIFSLSPR
jgi:hypothetical protein